MNEMLVRGILLEEMALDCDELARACGVSVQWVSMHVAAGGLPAEGDDPAAWRFSSLALRRARRLCELERSFDALPELAALVLDLQDEIARLRREKA